MKTFSIFSLLLVLVACSNPTNNAPATNNAPIAATTADAQMKQIQFESKGCYGTCPQFSLTIRQDGTASYDAREHNERKGQFTTTIAQAQMDSLRQLVEHAAYFSKQDNFPAPMTDVVEYKSTLTLNDGKTKTIVDQDPRRPAELRNLYKFLLSLKVTQNWK